MSEILTIPKTPVLWNATVELMSAVERPFRFQVTVIGQPPHARRRVYEVRSFSDTQAAMLGGQRFEREMSSPLQLVIAK
jgi:hypothetical protein